MTLSLPSNWDSVLVPTALDQEQPIIRPSTKIAARDYRPSGRYPIVDQSQNAIAGWTDSEEAVLNTKRPVIVFGDHSRTFKYIDRPFAAGADGTLILNPSAEFDPKFLFFACLDLDVPSRGYNRHYTLVREMFVPKPQLDEQRKIAAVLAKVQEILEVEAELIRVTRELKQGALQRFFTQGLRGETQKQSDLGRVPESWEQVRVDDLGEVVTGTTPKTANRAFYDGGVFDFIAPGDISEYGTEIPSAVKKLTAAGLSAARELPRGSSCFVCIGSSIGKVGLTTKQRSAFNQQINAVISSSAFDPGFVFYTLLWNAKSIASRASPSPVPIMSKSLFAEATVWITRDKDEQCEIAAHLANIDTKLAYHQARQKLLRELFRTLLRDLMTARRRVTGIELPTSAA
jgi:type I restriction enzyme S subunit